MTKVVFIVGIFLWSGCASVMPYAVDITEGVSEREIPYALLSFQPDSETERFPLVVAFAAAGWSASKYLELWKEKAIVEKVMILAPTVKRSYRNDSTDLEALYALVDEIAKNYPVDKDRNYIAGTSGGAFVAQWLLHDDPSRWRGAILISSLPSKEEFDLDAMGHYPPMLFVHGKKDTLFDYRTVEKIAEQIHASGVNVSLILDRGVGHGHHQAWNEHIFEWIRNQSQTG